MEYAEFQVIDAAHRQGEDAVLPERGITVRKFGNGNAHVFFDAQSTLGRQMIDPPRQYAKPIEVLTKAILKRRFYDGEEGFYDDLDGFYRDIDPDHWFDAAADARVALAEMRKHGWISDLGMSAIRAEEASKNEHVTAVVSANPRKSNKMQEG